MNLQIYIFSYPEKMKTNILFVEIKKNGMTADMLIAQLKAEGVLVGPNRLKMIRAVTNYHVSREDIDYTLKAFKKVFSN